MIGKGTHSRAHSPPPQAHPHHPATTQSHSEGHKLNEALKVNVVHLTQLTAHATEGCVDHIVGLLQGGAPSHHTFRAPDQAGVRWEHCCVVPQSVSFGIMFTHRSHMGHTHQSHLPQPPTISQQRLPSVLTPYAHTPSNTPSLLPPSAPLPHTLHTPTSQITPTSSPPPRPSSPLPLSTPAPTLQAWPQYLAAPQFSQDGADPPIDRMSAPQWAHMGPCSRSHATPHKCTLNINATKSSPHPWGGTTVPSLNSPPPSQLQSSNVPQSHS